MTFIQTTLADFIQLRDYEINKRDLKQWLEDKFTSYKVCSDKLGRYVIYLSKGEAWYFQVVNFANRNVIRFENNSDVRICRDYDELRNTVQKYLVESIMRDSHVESKAN